MTEKSGKPQQKYDKPLYLPLDIFNAFLKHRNKKTQVHYRMNKFWILDTLKSQIIVHVRLNNF